ncbi:MAG: NAD-dependent epimerase/dehydratase family protein [Candidatus Omnitrophota bacterium]
MIKRNKRENKKGKILVTGATGFVGANLVRRLVAQDYDVSILTRRTSNKWRIKNILPEVNDYCVDLLDLPKLKKVVKKIKPKAIFHLATSGIYAGYHLPDRDLVEHNFFGTLNLIESCENIDYSCFVNTGSSSEYGPKLFAMKESDICQPVNTYGVTKLAATRYCSCVAMSQDKPILTLRLFSPYGPYDDVSRLMFYAVYHALRDEDLLLGDPASVRDYCYIDDVTSLYLKCIPGAHCYKGEVFNAGSGRQTRIGDIVKSIVRLSGSKSRLCWKSQESRPFEKNVKIWKADISKTKECLSWQPKYTIEEGLIKTISWFRKNRDLLKGLL